MTNKNFVAEWARREDEAEKCADFLRRLES
jgi:hypothetical protein